MKISFVLAILFVGIALPLDTSAAALRDPWLQPFASTSIWNMPIGSEAKFVPAGFGPAKTVGIDHERLFRVSSNAPVRAVFAPKSWETRAGGAQRLGEVQIDDAIVVPDARKWYTPNECAAFLMPDGRTLKQIAPLCRPAPGSDVFGYYFRPDEDLFGSGISGSHGGSAMSAIGGSIRLGELAGDAPIQHALKVDIFCERYAFYSAERKGFRWPARRADSYAKDKYKGTNFAVVMGSLLALPSNVSAEALALKTAVGKKLFRALQDYGAYVVDDAAWDCHYFCAEFGVAEEVERAYGLKWDGKSKELLGDINVLFTALAVVDNNAPDRIGGGGAPRVPLAPPLAEKSSAPVPATAATSAQPSITIRNASMTEGAEKPTGWADQWVASGKISVARDTATFHSAPASLRVESVGGAARGQAQQFIEAPPGTRFALNAFVKAAGSEGTRGVVGVQSYTADWKGIEFKPIGVAVAGLDWQQVRGEVTLPKNTARFAVLLLLEGNGKAWLDDVSVSGATGVAAESEKPQMEPPPKPLNAWSPGEGFYKDYPHAWRQVAGDQVKRAKQGNINVVFIGDSLTQGWDKEIWKAHWEPLGAVNFGVGGDGTPQVLERIRRGILDEYEAKAVVLMIGVNNTWPGYSAEDTIRGIGECLKQIEAKQPRAKILLLGMLPLFDKGDGIRKRVAAINSGIAKLADGDRVRFLDFGAQLLEPDGALRKDCFQGDRLHLKAPGYKVWLDAMEPVLKEMLKR